MKKVTVFLSKELQAKMESELNFKHSRLVKNALALVAFVTELALTGDRPRITFPVSGPKKNYLDPEWNDDGCLFNALKVTNRLEIHLWREQTPGADIMLECEFYLPGSGLEPRLHLRGCVKDTAVRYLDFQGYNPGRMVKQGRPKDWD